MEKTAKIIISMLYIVALLVIAICVPMSAIMLIFKACAATTLSWIACCMPAIVALAFSAVWAITKILLSAMEGK